MKISKIALLLILIILSLNALTSCRCEPSSVNWYLYSYKDNMTFINGVTLNLGFSDASNAYPFAGVENQNIGISFFEDGRVEFTTKEGTTLYGTYTYWHQRTNYTSFKITLENGEIIEGDAIDNLTSKTLVFDYKDVTYNFSNENKRKNITMDDVVKNIHSGNTNSLHRSTVVNNQGTYEVQFSDIVSYVIEEDTAVFAIRINSDGRYDILDEIYEGNVLSTYSNEGNYIVLYYIEK